MTPEQIAESVGQDVGDLTADDNLAGTVAGFSFYQGRKPKLTSGESMLRTVRGGSLR